MAEHSPRKNKKDEENEENDPKKQADEEAESSDEEAQRAAILQHLLSTVFMSSRNNTGNNEELVKYLKSRDVLTDPLVEDALRTIPRGDFIPDESKHEAYEDRPVRLASLAFNVSAPHMYAICLENLKFQKGNSFLDIGSGCGLLTCLGAYLVGKEGVVHGIDLRKDIIDFAQSNMQKFSQKSGLEFKNVKFFVHNCFLPTAEARTYDRIHVGACCPTALLDDLLKLLAPGGILVTPLEDRLVRIIKDLQGNPKTEKLMGVRYSDLIVPSEAEVKEALRQIEHEKATRIIVPDNTFVQDFARLCNNPEFSDVKLIVEGKDIPAHKVILAARSDHFKTMFFSGMKESSQSSIVLQDIALAPFLDVLTYIYSGNINIINADHAVGLVEIANYLKIDRLKAMCELELRKNIDVENAAYILQVAVQHEAWQLKSFAMQFIIENYKAVEKTKCFDELPKNLMKEVLSAACKKNSV